MHGDSTNKATFCSKREIQIAMDAHPTCSLSLIKKLNVRMMMKNAASESLTPEATLFPKLNFIFTEINNAESLCYSVRGSHRFQR